VSPSFCPISGPARVHFEVPGQLDSETVTARASDLPGKAAQAAQSSGSNWQALEAATGHGPRLARALTEAASQ
jgi:hypothetical protein